MVAKGQESGLDGLYPAQVVLANYFRWLLYPLAPSKSSV